MDARPLSSQHPRSGGSLHTAWRWFFDGPEASDATASVVEWWELRRIPYNAVVVATALISFSLYLVFIIASGELKPGEDAIEPIALLAAPLALIPINVAYTLGWLVELGLRKLRVRKSGPVLMKLGLGLSLLLVASPALSWGLALVVIKIGGVL